MNCSESCGNQEAPLWSLSQREGPFHPINWTPHRLHEHIVPKQQQRTSTVRLRKLGIQELPNEILSEIFRVFSPTVEELLIITTVCRTWRMTAHTTPRLWTQLTFSINDTTCSTRIQFDKDCLERSGGLPINIDLFILVLRYTPEIMDLIDTIGEEKNLSRCLSLKFRGPQFVLSKFYVTHGIPRLRSLAIDLCEVSPSSLAAYTPLHFGPTTKPDSMFLSCFRLRALTIGWDNLTHITVFWMFVEEIPQLLNIAPALTDCRLFNLQAEATAQTTPNDQTVTHRMIHRFHASFDRGCHQVPNAMSDFFRRMTLPNLSTLSLEYSTLQDFESVALTAFLRRSGSSVKTFSLAANGESLGQALIEVCLAIPRLTTFNLWSRPFDFFDEEILNVDPFFKRLCLDPGKRVIPANEVPILPVLQTFNLDFYGKFPWELLPGIIHPARPLQKVMVRSFVDLLGSSGPLHLCFRVTSGLEDLGNIPSDGSESSDSEDYDSEGAVSDGENISDDEDSNTNAGEEHTLSTINALREMSDILIPDWETYDKLLECRKRVPSFELYTRSESQLQYEWDVFDLSRKLLELNHPR